MKYLSIIAILLFSSTITFAQTDSTKAEDNTDTIKVGNFIIIRKNKSECKVGADNKSTDKNIEININLDNRKKNKSNNNINTNWFIFDLGFANYRDKTNYAAAQSMGYVNAQRPVNANNMALNTGKSSNVNFWFFMQKMNVAKQVLNLKYGLGLEMYNFRFDNNVSYRSNPSPTVFLDSVNFSKDKLYASYLTVPFLVNVNTRPGKHDGFSFSAGISAGYLLANWNKEISAERGKIKYRGNLNLEPWRLAAIGEVGIGPIRLYGSYSLNSLHKESTGLTQYPYAVGIRFSKW